MNTQLSHHSSTLLQQEKQIILISDGVSGPANIGGLFRLGDAFGVEKLVFCNALIDFSSPRLKKVSRDTTISVNYSIEDSIDAVFSHYKSLGYLLIGLELSSQSTPIQEFKAKEQDKIALVIGNEQHGISQNVLEQLDTTLHIEMFGKNSSMNVVNAVAIALFELTKRRSTFTR